MDWLAFVAAGLCSWETYKLWGPLPKPAFLGGSDTDLDWKAWGPFLLWAVGAVGALLAAF